MRIQELEAPQKTLAQIHQDWVRVSKAGGDISKSVYNKALEFSQGGADPVQAHAQALSAYNQTVDSNQDRQAHQRQLDRTAKGFTGTASDPSKLAIQGQGGSQPSTSSTPTGRGQYTKYKDGTDRKSSTSSKSLKQQIKDKWKDFQDADSIGGKSVGKGKFIAKQLGDMGKGISSMGDKFRNPPSNR
jgi:hypothetical protein